MRYKNYYNKHTEIINRKHKEKIDNDVYYKLKLNLIRMVYTVYNIPNDNLLWYYIGSTDKFLLKWFEYLNCDYSTKEYELDHIKPRSAFNFANIDERYLAHNWTNLRLIAPYENKEKAFKVDKELIRFYLVISELFLKENKDHVIFYEFLYEWKD